MTIYLDLIFIENIFMNFIIIYATGLVLKNKIHLLKIFLGSIIGAVYAIFYYTSKMEIYSNIILKIILSIVIVYVSFNSKTIKYMLKAVLIFYLTSFTFGGVSFALLYFINPQKIVFHKGVLVGLYPLKMVLLGGLIGFLIIVLSFKTIKKRIEKNDMKCEIKIKINNNETIVNGIVDTGNFLVEPITKRPVVIVESEKLKNIIPDEILDNLERIISGNIKVKNEYMSRIRLIPFTALGTENGLLLGIKADEIIIYYQEKTIKQNNVVVGIYRNRLSKANKYNALVGIDLI